MRKISKAIDTFSDAEYEECVYAINQFIDDSSYELLMARRGLEKIYRNKRVSESQKIELIEQLKSKISMRSETIPSSSKNGHPVRSARRGSGRCSESQGFCLLFAVSGLKCFHVHFHELRVDYLLQEEMKFFPIGDVWNEFCARNNTVGDAIPVC